MFARTCSSGVSGFSIVPRYSVHVPRRQTRPAPLPDLWLLSDARNDARLEQALRALPRGSGFVFRHYHLASDARRRRFEELAQVARGCGHAAILSGSAGEAERWRADGLYGPAGCIGPGGPRLRIATAHDRAEIEAANAIGADAVMLSPVFATRSHPDAPALGPERFRALAALARMPVIALGGMTAARARELDWPRWAAIDGLS
ncbi:thiamine phosphate synthase [Pelagerythrobacter aerophilus]|uniref:Thiamine phosphate synthase n=1 Tax=Pelagerythrobacter aerophilus TaxID=2306995 RepID=A0A418NEZ4_9SPHN|nr:thiamine phosphate synthase [Pelagerythrobacter aerophilus]